METWYCDICKKPMLENHFPHDEEGNEVPINLGAQSVAKAEMYYCKYCGNFHPVTSKEWFCPLDPAKS
jgi:hypothetical protein